MLLPIRALYLFAFLACTPAEPDVDGDGYSAAEDCNDNDVGIHPGADEFCDGVDNNCDGEIDEASAVDAVSWAHDADGDGFGDAASPLISCEPQDGYLADATDCDDTDETIHPDATEVWYDGVDQDCDAWSDYDQDRDGEDTEESGGSDCDDLDPEILSTATEVWYDGVDQDCDDWSDFDQDRDGEDNEASGGDDCDDTDASILSAAEEIWYDGVDQNCDDWSDYDADLDGEDTEASGGTDCDDTDATILSTATEIWYDGVDQNCDDWSDHDADLDGEDTEASGGTDCDDTDATVLSTATEIWYDGVDQDCDDWSDYDADLDGEDTEASGGTDCDDTDAAILSTATEIWYDGVDQDCDDWSDYDQDLDGEDTEASGGTDCDDTDNTILSTATEIWYDGVDQDCDDWSDYDADLDGEDSETYSGTDCDDTDPAILSTATEIWYDGVDQDCDDLSDYDADYDGEDSESYGGTDCDDTDSAILSTATEVWYDGVDQDCDDWSDYDADLDGEDLDTYGGTDCDDTDATILSTATEVWYDGVDQDCDAWSDYDADFDGYDSDSYSGTDCDDATATINPGATEISHDGTDQNCDGFDGPEVALDATSVTLTALSGYDATATAAVTVSNSGEGTLGWSASADQTWLGLSSGSGSEGDTLTLTADATSLAAGTHTAVLTVTDTDTGSSSSTFTVTLEIADTWSGTASTDLTHDDAGRLETLTDPTGEVITMTYDDAGRLTDLVAASGSAIGLGYDTRGHVDTFDSDYGTVALTYSADELQTVDYPSGDTVSYTWDSSGRVSTQTLPSGAVIATTYDSTYPLLPSRIVHSVIGTSTFTYDTDARPSTRTLPNGVSTAWTYETTFGKASTVTHTDSSGATLVELTYTYDDLGRVATKGHNDGTTTVTTTYDYDELGRLISESNDAGASFSWTYDDAGNRTEVVHDSETETTRVDSADRLLEQGQAVFEYDELGRMTARITPEGTTTYTWDAFSRLIEVDDGTDVVTYDYSGNDLLLERDDGSENTTFFYDQNGPLPRLLQTSRDNGTVTTNAHYLWAGNLVGVSVGSTSYDVLGDHLGTTQALHDGSSTDDFTYTDAFGQTESVPSLADPLTSVGFAGGWTDPTTGLVYLWHRWYDPATGRFMSPDHVAPDAQDPTSFNAYTYCGGDPVNYIDPTGLAKEGVDWGMTLSGIAKIAGGVLVVAGAVVAAPVTATGAAVVGLVALYGMTEVGFGAGQTAVGLAGGLDEGVTMPTSMVDIAAEIAKAQTDNPVIEVYIDGVAIVVDMAMPSPDKTKLLDKYHDLVDLLAAKGNLDKLGKLEGLDNQMQDILKDMARMQEEQAKYESVWESEGDIPADDERGGIYINATATVISDLTQINGAGIDQTTGQLVLFGEDGGPTSTGVDGDLLFTALQWMGEGVGTGFTAPGVTIENDLIPTEEPSPPDATNTYHGVGYFGGIEYTEMGFAAFEADRIMKGLSMGVDNEDATITYDASSLGVSAFETHIDFYESYYDGTSPAGWVRMWIEPDVMELTIDSSRDAFEFTEASMIVQYEDQTDATAVWDDYTDFTDLLTTYYDDIAVEITSWEDLREASKSISMAYWLYQNDLHKGLAWDWINAYEVEYYDTPWWTLEGQVTSSFEYGGTTQTTTHRGGASTTTFSDVYTADTGDVEAYWDEIENARSSDLEDSWTYTAPDGSTGVAVALPGARVPTSGGVHLAENDLFAPAPGPFALSLVRSYSSILALDGRDMGMGPGWSFVPYSTRASEVESSYGTMTAPVSYEIFDHRLGSTQFWELDGFNSSGAVYSCATLPTDDLTIDSAGIATWERRDGTLVDFDADGLLTAITGTLGDGLAYTWSSDELSDVTHTNGDSISLTWNSDGTLDSASTTTGWTTSYSYDGDGYLTGVTDTGGQDWTFDYGSDDLLSSIEASDGTVLFEATYDDLGRGLTQSWAGLQQTFAPDLLTRALEVTDGAGTEWLMYMDEAGRITQLEDGAGGIWEREYDSNGQLSVVTDPTGRTLTYTYNSSGLLHQVVDDEGNTWSTYWTWSSGSPMLVAYSLPDGSEYYLSLNSDGSIATVYEASLTTSGSSLTGASLTSALDSFTWDSAGGLDTWTQGSLTLDIDRDSDGLVTAVTDLWGVQRDYTYDAYGRLSTLTTPEGVALTYGWDSAHPTQMSTVTLGSTTQLTMTYDALGRLEDVEDALGSVTTFGYDSATGTLDEVATGDGAVWSYTRNGGGYLTGVDGSSGFSMTYSYDAAGRMNGTDVTVSLP